MVTLRLLGGASLESGQSPITGRSAQRRRIAVLALLALARRGLTRDKLIGYLWADHDGEKARRLLSESLYVLRRELGEDAIVVSGDELRLNPAVVQCDVLDFESALERGDFARAAAIYAGPFLDGFFVSDASELEHWIDGERDRLARAHGLVLEKLAEQSSAAKSHEDAVGWWRKLTEHDPYSGRFALGLMRALDAAGHRAAALQHARVHAALLREELDAEPDPEVAALADRLRDAVEPARPVAAAAAVPHDEPNTPAAAHVAKIAERALAEGGTVTFLFSDIEASTALLKRLGPRYADLLATHHAIIRESVREFSGREIDNAGDGFFVAFPRARDAVAAAVLIQRRITKAAWPDDVIVRVRMGLHTGEPALTLQGYVGMAVHRAARICAAANGGQILLSSATRELIAGDLAPELEIRDHGVHTLKDIDEPEHLYVLVIDGIADPNARVTQLPPSVVRSATLAAADAAGWPPSPSQRSTPRRLKRWHYLGPLGALLLAVALIALLWPPPPPPPPPGGPTEVAVFPFTVDDDDFREGMAHMLSHHLDGVSDLRPSNTYALLEQLRGREPTPDLANRIAADLGARLFILGQVIPYGTAGITLIATLYERYGAQGGPSHRPAVRVQGLTDSLPSLVDSLTIKILEAWIPEPQQSLTVTALRTSSSLAAIKAWWRGERAFRAARYDLAVKDFDEATQIDPSFGLAWYRLSMAAEWNLDFIEVPGYADKALQNMDGLSLHYQKLIRAWNDLISGNTAAAEQSYREITNERPEEVEARYGLGEALVHFNPARGRPIAEAREHFSEVLELVSNYGDARVHMLEFAAAAQDLVLFDSLYKGVDSTSIHRLVWRAVRAFQWGTNEDQAAIVLQLRSKPTKTIATAAASVATSLHDLAAARRITSLLSTSDDRCWQGAAHLMSAELNFANGKYEEAMAGLANAKDVNRSWLLEMRALFALPLFTPLLRNYMATLRDEVRQWTPARFEDRCLESIFGVHAESHPFLRSYLLGMLNVRLGDLKSANGDHQSLGSVPASGRTESLKLALSQSLRAHITRAEGGTNSGKHALERLENIQLASSIEQVGFSPFYSRAYDRLVIAELHREAGRDSVALRWYRSLTEGYDVLFVAPAHLRISELYQKMAMPDSADAHFARFETLWSKPDSTLLNKLRATTFW